MKDKSSPPLVKDDRVVDTHVYVGTNVWFNHWLADPNIESFRYECPEGSFTARRRKGDYWNAYRKVRGKLRQEYLGKSADLTQTKLIETARTLAMDNIEYWRMKYPRPDRPAQPSQEPTGLYNSSLDCITDIDSKETTNAVRQWCVFARHNNGKLQFMGGYWSKGDAEARMHKARREHHHSESIGDKPYIGPPPTYEVREMLVAPVGLYNHSPSYTTEIEAKVVELEKSLAMLSELHRESDLRRQELESLVDDYQTKRKYEAEESDRVQQPRILGIDLEEFYDAVMLGHPPRERKLIGKPLSRFKALIKEALTRRGVPVR
jgi:hypothetical protein